MPLAAPSSTSCAAAAAGAAAARGAGGGEWGVGGPGRVPAVPAVPAKNFPGFLRFLSVPQEPGKRPYAGRPAVTAAGFVLIGAAVCSVTAVSGVSGRVALRAVARPADEARGRAATAGARREQRARERRRRGREAPA